MFQAPDGGWDKAFQAKGTPLPRSWGCDNVLQSTKTYVSKRPDDLKVGISAAAALLCLYQGQQLHLAGHAWQTAALRPHTIIQKRLSTSSASAGHREGSAAHSELFFVIAVGRYAARVCPVKRVTAELLALEFRQWSWLVLTAVKETLNARTARARACE